MESEEVDDYGNPVDGSRLIYCCFPDCGCNGARLCMAEKGASYGSMQLNIEQRRRSTSSDGAKHPNAES